MEEKGVTEPSTAAWLSPIVLVAKPDGSKWMCLDYRGVNTHLDTDIYSLPSLEKLVEVASGNKFYTTIDLKEVYFQVELDEASRDLTTFSDGVSLYRFKRLLFGLRCSPAIFSPGTGAFHQTRLSKELSGWYSYFWARFSYLARKTRLPF